MSNPPTEIPTVPGVVVTIRWWPPRGHLLQSILAVLALIGTAATLTISGALDDDSGPRTPTEPPRGDVAAAGVSTTTAGPAASTTAAPTTTMPPRARPVTLAPTGAGPLLGATIVVDPGHNGLNYRYSDIKRAGDLAGDGPSCNTAGASTNAGLDEMVINFEIGRRLATLLRANGATVILTHGDLGGFGPCADERGIIARDAHATALISIHADGSTADSSGFHVIAPAPKPTLAPASVAESARLAGIVRDELLVIGGRPANYVGTRGIQIRDDLANLNQANRPAILAELGNLRNGTDAAMLSADVTYVQIARALARAAIRFVGRVPDHADLSADVTGDGWPDFLLGAPQLATTTTVPPPTVPPTLPATTVPLDTTTTSGPPLTTSTDAPGG